MSFCSPRLLVRLEERASCQIIEEYIPAEESGHYFCNAVAEIDLAEESSLRHG